jgi:hypothetical protein
MIDEEMCKDVELDRFWVDEWLWPSKECWAEYPFCQRAFAYCYWKNRCTTSLSGATKHIFAEVSLEAHQIIGRTLVSSWTAENVKKIYGGLHRRGRTTRRTDCITIDFLLLGCEPRPTRIEDLLGVDLSNVSPHNRL